MSGTDANNLKPGKTDIFLLNNKVCQSLPFTSKGLFDR